MNKSILLMSFLALSISIGAQNPEKRKQRVTYIYKTAKISKEEQKKVSAVLDAFLSDMHANKKEYDEVKKKYEVNEDKGTLTAAQASELMTSKFTRDEKDLRTRRLFFPRLKAQVGAVKAREIIKCSDDKLKK